MLPFLAQAAPAHSVAAIPIPHSPVVTHPPPTAAGGGMLVGILLLCAVYFFPTIRAWMGNHPKKWPVLILNFLGGWTIIGYFVALKWSAPITKAGTVLLSPEAAAAAAPNPVFAEARTAPSPAPAPQPIYITVPSAPAPPPSESLSTPSQDDVEKLAKLGALYEKGLLSAEEFQKAKERILS